jgi:hypothetical protein
MDGLARCSYRPRHSQARCEAGLTAAGRRHAMLRLRKYLDELRDEPDHGG